MAPRLRDEIRQRRPFGSLEQEAHLSVVRTAAVLGDKMDQLLKASDITSAQYNVLRILRGAEPDGLCRNELRDRMVTRMPDMTRLLDRMEEAGLVTRERQSDDRRMVRTQISDRGRRLLSDLDDAVADGHRCQLGHLSRTELKTLIDLLARARAAPSG